MAADGGPLLSWETSAGSEPEIARQLPQAVVSCLENARFLHLATCVDQHPHISLMNYTYLAEHPFGNNDSTESAFSSGPVIVMTTNPSSRKTLNLVANPNVSLLVHDWVSHRPLNQQQRSASPPGRGVQSSLASLLMGLNTSAMGSISATINGTAHVLSQGSEQEKWCKTRHLANNTYDDADVNGPSCCLDEQDIRVVIVKIRDGRIADSKGAVRDWVLAPDMPGTQHMTNGV